MPGRPPRPRGGAWLLLAIVLATMGCMAPPPPVIESVRIEPSSLDTNAMATVRVEARDPRGEDLSFTYQWMKNGTPIPGATAASLDLSSSGNGARGDAIAVRVVADTERTHSKPTTSEPRTVTPSIAVNATESRESYAVEGADSRALFASIERNGPRKDGRSASGLAQFGATRRLRTIQTADTCAIDAVTIEATAVLTLPAATAATRSADLAAKIERFRAAVVTHEERHVTIRREYLDQFVTALQSIDAAPSCEAIERAVAAAWERTNDAENRAQDRFHEEDAERIRVACAPIDTQMAGLTAQLEALRGQPARYNALVPAYNGLLDDYRWCLRS